MTWHHRMDCVCGRLCMVVGRAQNSDQLCFRGAWQTGAVLHTFSIDRIWSRGRQRWVTRTVSEIE
eukprot:7304366-Prymnesium_polylepis.2